MSQDNQNPLGGVDAEGIRGEIINEPNEGDGGLNQVSLRFRYYQSWQAQNVQDASSKTCSLSSVTVGNEIFRQAQNLLENQPVRVFVHPLPVELFRLVQLDPQVQQTEWRDHSQPQSNPPDRTEVILGEDQDQDHGDEIRDDKAKIDDEVGKEDEPTVAVARFELTGTFGRRDRTGRVLAANTNTQKETVSRESSEETILTAMVAIGPCTQRGEDNENDGRSNQRPPARPVITGNTENQLAYDRPRESDGGDILTGGRLGICIGIDRAQQSVHGPNNLGRVQVCQLIHLEILRSGK